MSHSSPSLAMSHSPPSLTLAPSAPWLLSLFLPAEDQPCPASHHDHHHHQPLDPNRRRLYGNINTQLNSSRLPLGPHIATQIREPSPPCCDTISDQTPLQPRGTYAATRPPTPPPRHIAPPQRFPRRSSTASIPDTRRHGMVLSSAPLPTDEDEALPPNEEEEELPAYTPGFRRVNTTPHHHHRRRGGSTRRATFPRISTPVFHPAFDFEVDPPPPYARADPHPVPFLEAGPRRPGLVARVLLPFKGEGRVLGRVRRGLRIKGGC